MFSRPMAASIGVEDATVPPGIGGWSASAKEEDNRKSISWPFPVSAALGTAFMRGISTVYLMGSLVKGGSIVSVPWNWSGLPHIRERCVYTGCGSGN